jgi:hypothetical protein
MWLLYNSTLLKIRVFQGFLKEPQVRGFFQKPKRVFQGFFGKTSWMKVLNKTFLGFSKNPKYEGSLKNPLQKGFSRVFRKNLMGEGSS